ncbi:MAG: hydroxymethylglutaryl-CoA reductase, partial [Nanoarchaeota archaeon]
KPPSRVGEIVGLLSKYVGNETIISDNKDFDEDDVSGVPRRTEHSESARQERIKWLKERTGVELKYVLGKTISSEILKGNIEHYIGMSQIPIGIAGPMKVNGENANGLFYVPLATTEGALVASVNRGMHIITKAGGANTKVLSEQLTKAPMFIFENGESAIRFVQWVEKNFDNLKGVTESTTKHGKLIGIDKFLIGRRVIIKLCYSCGDALGANMITIATQKICEFIKKNYPIENYLLQSNLEGEKKVSYLNFFSGRGKRVYADVIIKRDIVEKYLHTSVEEMVYLAHSSLYGSLISGMIGANAHIANILTAIFISTGQDVAHVHDASIGVTTIDKDKNGDLYISVNLP